MAEQRVEDALHRLLAGERLPRRERKVAYNGAEGVPIREEVLSRHCEEVISRNAYGAHCLNSPRVLFADVDYEATSNFRELLAGFSTLAAISIGAGLWLASWKWTLVLLFASMVLAAPMIALIRRAMTLLRGGHEAMARKRLTAFLANRPDWNVRIYETPAGLRYMVTHRAFSPAEPEVDAFFQSVSADPLYVRMCKNQQCFRARLTAKPWRIGISDAMRPRPGVWPVQEDKRARRDEWINRYEALAAGFSACRYVDSKGSGKVHVDLSTVVELHDTACRARQSASKLA